MSSTRVWTIPNLISVLRLACVPVFLWLLWGKDEPIAAAGLLAVLGATDWVDGYIARHFDQGSELGKILDPTADRVMLVAAAVALLVADLPVAVDIVIWLVLFREVIVAAATIALAIAGARRIDVVWAGKAGTLAVMFALPLFLWADAIDPGLLARVRVVRGLVLRDIRPRARVLRRRQVRPGRARRAARRTGDTGAREVARAGKLECGGARMKAVILAGGEGTRLRPLTSNQPKPMMPIANVPMMEHIVRLLAKHGFDDIVVTVAFLANHIRNYFGDGSDFDVQMRYATEESPLGTAGSVRNAMDELDETFLVISGDVLTDVDLSAFVEAHRKQQAFASIALKRVENPVEFGIVITREDGSIERFLEKPTWGEVFSDTINTGIYVLEPGVFDHIPPDEVVDFSGDVFPSVLESGGKLYGHVLDGYWEDVGTLEAYRTAHEDILDGRVEIDVPGFLVRDGVWLGENVDVSPDVVVEGPVLIGDNCRIETGAVLRPYTVLGDDVVVKAEAHIERTVVHDHVYLGPGTRVRGAVLGRSCDIRDSVRIEEGVVVGDETFIGAEAIINPSVKIYPFKSVDPGALVTSSIVWETRGARTLFGRRGVRGLANVDVTAEVAVRLAMAYGTALKKGSVVCTSRDTSRSARALKRAFIAGLNLSGVHVMDLELATVPATRFQVRSERGTGRDHGAARPERPRQRRDPFPRREGRRHRRRHPAQDRAAPVPRGLPPRVRR